MAFSIRWKTNHIEYYKYGSLIEFRESSVYFENELMPAGAAIVSWKSNINYIFDRTSLQLPLLERLKTYEIYLDAQVFPEESILIKIDFYDRVGQIKGTKILYEGTGEFTFPEDAFSYRIYIVNTGVKKFLFHKILIKKKGEP